MGHHRRGPCPKRKSGRLRRAGTDGLRTHHLRGLRRYGRRRRRKAGQPDCCGDLCGGPGEASAARYDAGRAEGGHCPRCRPGKSGHPGNGGTVGEVSEYGNYAGVRRHLCPGRGGGQCGRQQGVPYYGGPHYPGDP